MQIYGLEIKIINRVLWAIRNIDDTNEMKDYLEYLIFVFNHKRNSYVTRDYKNYFKIPTKGNKLLLTFHSLMIDYLSLKVQKHFQICNNRS